MNQASTHAVRPRRRRKKFRRFLTRLLVLVVVVGFIYLFFISDVFLVDIVIWQQSQNGGGQEAYSNTPPKNIVEEVEKELQGKKWGVFPRRNYFFLPEKEMSRVMERFPSYQNISFEKRLPSTLTIYYKHHQPVSVVIQSYKERILIEPPVLEDPVDEPLIPVEDEYEEIVREQGFRLSDAGVVLEKIHIDSIDSQEVVLTVRSPRVVEIGDSLIDERLFRAMQDLQELFEPSIHIPIESFEVGDNFLPHEIHVVTREGWKVYFDWSKDTKEQIHILQTLLSGALQEKRQTIQYIDLRIKDKVFYK